MTDQPPPPVVKQPLNLRLDADLIRRLKHEALNQDRTVADLVTELAIAYLDREVAR